MKTKRNLLLMLSLLMTLFYNCQSKAQEQRKITPEKMADMQTNMQQEALDLDEAEVEQMKSINLNYAKKMQPLIREIRTTKNKEKFTRLRTLNQEKNYEVAQILSREQYEAYMKLQKKMRQKMRKRRKQ